MQLTQRARTSTKRRWRLLALPLLGLLLWSPAAPIGVADASSAVRSPVLGPDGRLVRPNVLVVLTDDQAMDAVAKMPWVSSRRDWTTFTAAYAEVGLCCPSRATILQGRYDTKTGVLDNGANSFDPSLTVAVGLQAAGYRTGLFGKYLNSYKGAHRVVGWDDWFAAFGNSQYDQYDYQVNDNGTVRSYGRRATDYEPDVITGQALAFMRRSSAQDRPWFAFVTPTATHRPHVASPTRVGWYDDAPTPDSPNVNEADLSDKPSFWQPLQRLDRTVLDQDRQDAWAAGISVDDTVRRMDQYLKASGQYDNTVVVFATDNGYSFGSHRWERKRCVYEECAHIPLLVRYPGRPARSLDQLVSNVDLASTITDVAGARPLVAQDGRSLLPLVAPVRGRVPSWRSGLLLHWAGGGGEGEGEAADALPQFWAVRTERYKYAEHDTGDRELYDLAVDPYELDNAYGDPAYAEVLTGLRAQLARLKSDARAGAQPPDVSTPAAVQPRSAEFD